MPFDKETQAANKKWFFEAITDGYCAALAGSEFDLISLPEDENERCPNLATCRWYNETEWIPLCAEHYDIWCREGGPKTNKFNEMNQNNPAIPRWGIEDDQ